MPPLRASSFVSDRTRVIAGCVLCFFLSVLASALLAAAYPTGFLFPDSLQYFLSGTSSDGSLMVNDVARPPLTGMLMRTVQYLPDPAGAFFWVMAALFSCGLAALCWLGTLLFRSIWKGVAFTLLFLGVQVWMMEPFFANLFLLSDPLYMNLLFAGTLVTICGWLRTKPVAMIGGCVLLGLAGVARNVEVVYVLWIPTIFLLVRPWKRRKEWLLAAAMLAVLLAPTVAWRLRNVVVYGRYERNPYVSRHLATLVPILMQEGDDVFGDPAMSASFLEAVRSVRLPADHAAPDPFGRTPDHVLGVIQGFYGSLTAAYAEHGLDVMTKDFARYAFETAAIGRQVTFQLMHLHPVEYRRETLLKYAFQFNPVAMIHEEPIALKEEPSEALKKSARSIESNFRETIYPPDGIPNTEQSRQWAVALLRSISVESVPYRIVSALPIVPHAVAHFMAWLCLALVMLRSEVRAFCVRRRIHDPTSAAGVGLFLFLSAAAHFLSMAAVTDYMEPRYALPGSLFLPAFYLVVVCSLLMFLSQLLRSYARHR